MICVECIITDFHATHFMEAFSSYIHQPAHSHSALNPMSDPTIHDHFNVYKHVSIPVVEIPAVHNTSARCFDRIHATPSMPGRSPTLTHFDTVLVQVENEVKGHILKVSAQLVSYKFGIVLIKFCVAWVWLIFTLPLHLCHPSDHLNLSMLSSSIPSMLVILIQCCIPFLMQDTNMHHTLRPSLWTTSLVHVILSPTSALNVIRDGPPRMYSKNARVSFSVIGWTFIHSICFNSLTFSHSHFYTVSLITMDKISSTAQELTTKLPCLWIDHRLVLDYVTHWAYNNLQRPQPAYSIYHYLYKI